MFLPWYWPSYGLQLSVKDCSVKVIHIINNKYLKFEEGSVQMNYFYKNFKKWNVEAAKNNIYGSMTRIHNQRYAWELSEK